MEILTAKNMTTASDIIRDSIIEHQRSADENILHAIANRFSIRPSSVRAIIRDNNLMPGESFTSEDGYEVALIECTQEIFNLIS